MPKISKDLVNYCTVGAEEAGQRLDNYLFKVLKGVPKSHIQRIIRSGEVRINKKRVQAADRLAEGDTVRIPPVRTASEKQPDSAAAYIPARTFGIVFEDDAFLVINKPGGIAVHGGSGIDFGVIEQLRRARPEAKYLELVHRLDKDTSGLLMIAKKRSALVRLHEAIRQHEPQKIYRALIVGRLPEKHLNVKLPLLKYTGAAGEKMVRVDENGQTAHTVFRELAHYTAPLLHQHGITELSLVEAALKTGRTHQIRVHLQAQHCPIAGDERYGNYQANRRLKKIGLKRMFLHAHTLQLNHPLSGEPLTLTASLPDELSALLTQLAPPNDGRQ